jgi:hypothetical protein
LALLFSGRGFDLDTMDFLTGIHNQHGLLATRVVTPFLFFYPNAF